MGNLITVRLKQEQQFSLLGAGMDSTTIPTGALGVVINAAAQITKDKELSCAYTVYWLVQDHASECRGELLEVVSFPRQDSDVQVVAKVIAELAQLLVSARSLDTFPQLVALPDAEKYARDFARFNEIFGGLSKADKVDDA